MVELCFSDNVYPNKKLKNFADSLLSELKVPYWQKSKKWLVCNLKVLPMNFTDKTLKNVFYFYFNLQV